MVEPHYVSQYLTLSEYLFWIMFILRHQRPFQHFLIYWLMINSRNFFYCCPSFAQIRFNREYLQPLGSHSSGNNVIRLMISWYAFYRYVKRVGTYHLIRLSSFGFRVLCKLRLFFAHSGTENTLKMRFAFDITRFNVRAFGTASTVTKWGTIIVFVISILAFS